MPRKKLKRAKMSNVVPVKMDDKLYERLKSVAAECGEAESTVIRLVLRAGLEELERTDHNLVRLGEIFPATAPEFSAETNPQGPKKARSGNSSVDGQGA